MREIFIGADLIEAIEYNMETSTGEENFQYKDYVFHKLMWTEFEDYMENKINKEFGI